MWFCSRCKGKKNIRKPSKVLLGTQGHKLTFKQVRNLKELSVLTISRKWHIWKHSHMNILYNSYYLATIPIPTHHSFHHSIHTRMQQRLKKHRINTSDYSLDVMSSYWRMQQQHQLQQQSLLLLPCRLKIP